MAVEKFKLSIPQRGNQKVTRFLKGIFGLGAKLLNCEDFLILYDLTADF
jgi:hypothetical protein